MTLSVDGVRLNVRQHRWGLSLMILAAEAVLSFFLYVSFAAHILWPDSTHAAVGVSTLLSYEGRLMDASGNPLGGTGEPYCYRFSIYDSSTAGSKLWPSGGPNVTVSTTTDGVFTALVGQADALTYNFYDSDTVYLNVDVNTATSTDGSTCGGSWETLSPRQQIAASGYSQAAKNVYGSMLKTNISSNRVDVGSGTGSASPVLLALDVNTSNQYVGQTCSTNGTMWYNFAQSQALICEAGLIQGLGISGTTTVAALQTNGNAPISAGTVFFSNGNGVSWGNNGQTITASINAGATLSQYENMPFIGATQTLAISSNSWVIAPFTLPEAVSASYIRLPVTANIGASTTMGTTANTTMTAKISQTLYAVIYKQGAGGNSQSLQYVTSAALNLTQSWSFSANAVNGSVWTLQKFMTLPSEHGTLNTNFAETHQTSLTNIAISESWSSRGTGMKYLDFPFATSLSAGNYWIALGQSIATGTNVAAATRLLSVSQAFSYAVLTGVGAGYGFFGQASNGSNTPVGGAGLWTTNVQGTTNSIGLSSISSSASAIRPYFQIMLKS